MPDYPNHVPPYPSHGHHTWQGDGLRIVMSHEQGETHKHALRHKYHFQCPPLETITIQNSSTHFDYQVIRAGQFSRFAGRNLTVVTFSSLFVEYGEFVVRSHQWNPQKQIKRLRQIVKSGTPFRLQIGEFLPKEPEVNMIATLRDFSVEHRAGEPDTRYFNVEFHQYRPAEARRRRRGHHHGHHGHHNGNGNGGTPASHKLKDTDTLHSLARDYYGKPTLGRRIGALNRDLQNWGASTPITQNRRWHKGDYLQIPDAPDMERDTKLKAKVSRDDLLDARDDLSDELFPGDEEDE